MNAAVKIAVIYYSATGMVAEIAKEIAETAEKAGAETRLRAVSEANVPVATPEDLVWADGALFGSPTRFGNVAAPLKQYLDTLGAVWQQGLLANKVYSGFTSTGTRHGGHESTLLALSHTFHHFGGIIVPPGYTDPAKFVDGNPYGTSHFDQGGSAPVDDMARQAARVQAKRVVDVARATASLRPQGDQRSMAS